MKNSLVLKGITKQYGDKLAVDSLNLSVPQGIIYGLIGPNGAGKTTTIRMIMNIIAPDSGEVLYDDKKTDSAFKDIVGYLPEERGLYKKMTLKEVILYMGRLKQTARTDILDRMDGWLDKMNLSEYKNKKVQELSKGMQQKLQLITTLIHNPSIIILDELFSGLDPINIELVKNIILELKRDGRTILFSTHVMEQAEKLCDNICMISAGKKVLDGPLSIIKSQHGGNNIRLEIEGDGSFLDNIPAVKNVSKFTNYFELSLDDMSNANNILKEIANRVTIIRYERIEPSLYNIFLSLAGDSSSVKKLAAGESNE